MSREQTIQRMPVKMAISPSIHLQPSAAPRKPLTMGPSLESAWETQIRGQKSQGPR